MNWLPKLKIFGAVMFYTVSAIAAVIGNKFFLRSVNVPVTFLFLQLLVCSAVLILSFGIAELITKQPTKEVVKVSQKEVLKILGPMIVLNAFGLAFNIVCLHKIDSIMYQITRGMTLPLTALIGPLFKNDSGSWRVFALCTLIFSGFVVAVSGEFSHAKFSYYGLAAGIAASFTYAMNSHLIKKSFASEKFSALDMVYYNNIYSMLALLPLALAYEGFKILETKDVKSFTVGVLVSGILGFLINYAGFIQIKVTSPVTHSVSCGARGILQVIASCLFLHEKVSWTRAAGLGISLLGSSIYPVVKSIDNTRSKKAAEAEGSVGYCKVESPTLTQEIAVNPLEAVEK